MRHTKVDRARWWAVGGPAPHKGIVQYAGARQKLVTQAVGMAHFYMVAAYKSEHIADERIQYYFSVALLLINLKKQNENVGTM